jgi:hypothetical protein
MEILGLNTELYTLNKNTRAAMIAISRNHNENL